MAVEYNAYLTTVAQRSDCGPLPCWASAIAHLWPSFSAHDHFDSPVRRVALEFVGCEPSVHQTIQATAGVTRLLPLVSVTRAQLRTHYDTPLTTLFTGAQLTALRNALEAVGFDTGWTGAATTMRDLLRRFIHHHYTHQICFGKGQVAMNALHALPLTATMASLTSAQRTQARAWMTSKGIDSSWITASSTVREVCRYITEHLPDRGFDVAGVVSA